MNAATIFLGLSVGATMTTDCLLYTSTNEYKFDLEIDIETAIIRSELEREQLKVLQREINNLTQQQREVLYLKYYKKMSSDRCV